MLRPDTILFSLLFGLYSSTALAGPPSSPPAVKKAAPVVLPLTGCQPKGTPKDDFILCLGTDLRGIVAGRGDDQVTITLGAIVNTFAVDPKPITITIDGGDGDDSIINNGTVIAEVISLGNGLKGTPALGSGKSPGSDSATDDKKTATAIGIDGGEGDDNILNTGAVTAISLSTAAGASTGPGISGGSVGSSEARARSIGISGGDADDTVFNSGTVTAVSDAVALKGEISTGGGLSTSNDAATAEASATDIDGGSGADVITNDGTIVAVANATIATAGSPGDADLPLSSSADSGNMAEATATGISGGGGVDDVDNSGEIVAVAAAESESLTLSLSANGSATADTKSTAKSSATAVELGDGADVLNNDGSLVATATSIAAGQGAQVSDSGGTPFPKSSWKGEVTADSSAVGASGGEGNDSITNNGAITAVATSVTSTSTVAASASDVASAASTAKATAKAVGVDAGDGGDWVTNDGSIVAVSTATAGALDFALSQNGAAKAAHEGGATAEAEAVGISADGAEDNDVSDVDLKILPHSLTLTTRFGTTAPAGNDTITNSGSVTAVATALSGAESGAVSITGAATSNMSSTAKSTAVGIDAGAGNDSVTNSGEVTAVSNAAAGAIGIGFSESGKAAIKGGPEAEATAVGISGDGTQGNTVTEATQLITRDQITTSLSREETASSGADTITNSGAVTAVATAVSGSEGAAVSISGAASTDFNAKATSKATALDAGSGDDVVNNSGALTAVSSAVAGTVGIGFSESGKSEAKAGATAEAEATGISGDGVPGSKLTEGSLSIGPDGVAIGFHREVNAATGDDSITNSGAVTAVATAVSGSGTAAVSISGAASAEAKSTAKSTATAIDAGAGDDTVTNSGVLTSVSTATATALGISFSESGEAKVEGGPEAEATAMGISGDSTQTSSLIDGSLVIGPDGLAASILYEKTAASGDDTINNTGVVTAVATAASGSVGAAISVSGAASADTSSKAKAIAAAIDAGGGDDRVTNSGVLTSVATAAAGTAGIGFSESDKGEAKAGATAEAEAFGIRGDGTEASSSVGAALSIGPEHLDASFHYESTASSGADSITNEGVVTAVATAITGSEAVGVSISKAASAEAESTSTATAVGIDAGAGDDTVSNSGVLTSVSTATALTLGAGISESKEGAASAAATSEATAIGISGDGIFGYRLAEGSLAIVPNNLELSVSYEQTSATGVDTITNDGVITAAAVATSGSGSLGVSIKGAASADASSSAYAAAAGIDAGGGDDEVTNNGVLTSVAIATAGELSAAVSGKGSATSLKSIWEGGSSADASARGITGDSTDRDFSTESTLSVDLDAPSVEAHSKTNLVQAGGNDTITNNGVLTATAIANTPSVDVTVALDGMAASVTTSEAAASSIAIDGGTGDDVIQNSGVLTATSLATAATANVAISPKGSAIAADSVWDGGTTAEATAVGISGDGEGQEWSAEGNILANADGVRVDASYSSTKVAGNDDITNDGVMVVTSVALVPTVTVAVPVKGAGAAISASTATATAIGIDAGSGDDTVLNQGAIVSTSIAVAAAANVAVSKNAALAGNSFWDGGTTANSRAVGISGDGEGGDLLIEGVIDVTPEAVLVTGKLASTTVSGEDDITNEAAIVATSIAEVPSLSVAVTSKGLSAAISAATANSQAVGIDAGAGDDVVSNNASITATSIANANVANVAVVVSGGVAAAWDGGATANAEATGISGDGEGQDLVIEGSVLVNDEVVRLSSQYSDTTVKGDDIITNDGVITATALAAAPSLGVAVTPSAGLSVAVTNAAANSKATGINAGSGDDVVENNGVLTATSVALAGSVSVAYVSGGVTVAGNSVWDGGTTTEAEAVGISGDGVGRDLIVNGEIEVADGDVRIASELTDHTVAGDDTITNTGVVTASSLASSTSVGVAVTLSGGVSVALATSTAKAKAVGIDAGSGDDIVDNTGVLTSTAVANANTLSVAYATAGVAVASDAVMDGGTTAEAEAIGIDGDGVGRDLTVEGLIEVTDAGTLISGRIADEVVAGDDAITNDGVITATAVALAPSVGVSVTPGGLSVALTTATTKARSAAIDAGSGDDVVDNTGVLTATSAAISVAVPIAVTPAGVAIAADAVWDGGTHAEAEAIGISGDGEGMDHVSEFSVGVSDGDVSVHGSDTYSVVSGDDTITNDGTVTATAVAESLSVAVSVTPAGLAVASSTSTAKSRAAAIDAGSGDDIVDNSGTLTSTSVANANALSVAVVAAGVSVASDAVWDGGTHAEADAVGIAGDGEGRDDISEFSTDVDATGILIRASDSSKVVSGNDDITNSGVITTTAVAFAPSVGVAVTPTGGVSVALSTASTKARSVAIDAGSGDDIVDNSGRLVATSVAVSVAIPVSVTVAGVAIASDAVWDGGTHAEAEAIGISGDGEGTDFVSEFSVDVSDGDISIHALDAATVVSGDDTITNDADITAVAVAESLSAAVSVTPAGLAVALSTSTAQSRAAAIDAGSGDDIVDNSGKLVATSVANANAVSVSVVAAGVSVASDAVWDGGTHAAAEAVGIAGDGEGRDLTVEGLIEVTDAGTLVSGRIADEVVAGNDDITNSGEVIATAVAVAPSIGVAVTPTGGVSVALSTASTRSRAIAIDAGSGDDIVDNSGNLVATSTAVAVAIPVSVTVAGVAIAADAIWDGGTHAEAEAVGISGDGEGIDFISEFTIRADDSGVSIGTLDTAKVVSGDDTITNDADVTAVAVGVATSIGVSVTPAGVSVSASTATAKARAAAIDAGSGDDVVENDGHLTASANAVGVAIPVAVAPVGFAVAADAIWDGGTSAEAEAVGIDGDGRGTDFATENTFESTEAGTLIRRTVSSSVVSGDDMITNTGRVEATAVAVAPSIAFSLGVVGGVSVANATATSYAAGIDAGAGDDEVLNQGHITANSVANADAIAISAGALAGSGNAVFDGGTTAEADAVGIYGDGRGGNTSSVFTIESDGLVHQITHVDSAESATGDDIITNEAQVEAYATAVAPTVSLAVGGLGVTVSTSTARARSAAIDAGAGDDIINNSGALTADADAVAVAANVSISGGLSVAADAVWDGGTTAEAEAVGISGDGQSTSETTVRGIELTDSGALLFEHINSSSLFGNDDITNSATVDATAEATAVSVGVAFSGMGGAVSVSTATAQSRAAAIEAGGGDDTVLNEGDLTAEANSAAVAVNVSLTAGGVSAALDAVWDGGTTAEAEAVGINGDGQKDSITRDKTIAVSASGVDISDETVRTSTDGDDNITNTASIESGASANSTSVGVSFVGTVGVAVAISTSTAEAKSTAIRAGGGDDTILNQGALIATSMADADGVSVSIVPLGAAVSTDAFWDGGTTAEANSIGIDGGAGNDTITNQSSITAVSIADARSTGVAVSVAGIASAISASTADAHATAINGADGDDTIDNSGTLQAASSATAKGTSVSVGLVGFASADSSAVAGSRAIGIDTGDGADIVSNTGDIFAGAEATATGADVTVTLVGAGFADSLFEGETRADALAAGIVGGDGTDELTNDAVITLGSNAEISAVSVSVDLVGFADADASATASAQSIGMAGGGSDDILNNRGVIAASAISSAPARSVSVGLIGASSADATTTAIAATSGLEGGAGNDGLYNLGAIGLVSEASAQAKSVNVTLAGAGHADADAEAIAYALGLGGGAGDDEVFNFGTIILGATAEARALGTSVGIFGVASQTARTTGSAFATGLDGGDGDDLIANVGFLQAQATANADVSNAAWQLAGTASQQGFVSAEALSVGMAGGSGLDILFNNGSIDVDVNSTLISDGSVTAVFGAGSANGSLDGTLGAIGISGGQGDDQIINAGLVSVNSNLNASSSGTAWNLFGVAGVTAGMTSDTSLYGFAGGDGEDIIANTGTLLVGAYSAMIATNSSWTFGGASDGAGSLLSITRATGMAGNDGVDWIHNEGLVDVDAISVLSASGGSNAIFGSASAGASLRDSAFATGMDGGDGDDVLENLSDINVNALATLSSTTASFTFIGGASGSADLSALAEATGMAAGSGSDQIYNGGSVLVGADAVNTAAGGAQTIIGDASAGATTAAAASAIGVSAGGGNDLFVNTGLLAAVANASPNSISDVSAGGFFVDGVSQADTSSTADALGVGLGDDDNVLGNFGDLSALVGGAGLADAASTGSPFSLTADAFADARSEISATQARGVSAGDGANQINNQGNIAATVAITTAANADADGAGLVGGNGDANALARADAISATGIDVGNGDNLIANGGDISVLAGHEAYATSLSDANGINFFEAANSTAATLAFADDALAIGVRAGDGGNTIWNGGTISVTAAPEAFAWSRGLSTDFSFAVDAAANAEAYVNNARAYGILAGNGANLIQNDGVISVTSAPRAEAIALSDGKGWDGDAESTAIASANGALAVGIFAGDGGNLVINNGSISALSTPAAFATATALPGGAELAGAVTNTTVCTWRSRWNIFNWILQRVCTVVADIADGVVDDGEAVVVMTVEVTGAEAVGIWTGAGDDVIVNNGSITTWVNAGPISRAGIAIRTGAGNDSVLLKDGSSLLGDVDLGADDDSLYLLGTPEATGDFYGGTGTDALLIDGSSQLFGGAYGFETLTLYGFSNFTLNSLGAIEDLGIYEGTLNVLGSYAMSPSGGFSVHIKSDGSHGQFNVGGNISLGGALSVTNSAGPYVNGTTYDIITAGSVSGSFASQSLPTPTTLVSFSTQQDATTFNVVANVIPFVAMASGSSETSVAGYLDDILPSSTGDLSALLAMMQAMPEEDFGAAFRSLNPGTYDTYQATDSTMRHHLAGTQSRLAGFRAAFRQSGSDGHAAFMSDREPVYLSAVNFDARFSDQQSNGANIKRGQPLDAWLVSFISDGSSSGRSNVQGSNFNTSGMSMGIDYAIQDNLVAGVSFGSAFTKSDIAGGYGQGELASSMTSLYATYLPSENTYVETVVSRSKNYSVNKRELELGAIQREAWSGRRGDIFSTFVETGRTLGTGLLRSEIFGSLYYSSLNENGFEEIGAGDINIIVDERHYKTISTELGWRGSRDFKTKRGLLTPQINVTLLRNFDFGDKSMSVRFAGVPDLPFSPAGSRISGYGVRLGLGLNFVEENGWAVQAKLNGEASGRRNNLSGVVQMSRKF